MMDIGFNEDFAIPLDEEELVAKGYTEEFTADELMANLKSFSDLMKEGSSCIELASHFETFFNCARRKQEVDINLRIIAWKVLIKCQQRHLDEVRDYLVEVVENGQHYSDDNRRDYLNSLQMNVYLLCRLAEFFERAYQNTVTAASSTTGDTKRKRKNVAEMKDDWGWNEHKIAFLRLMAETFRLSVETDEGTVTANVIRHLWSPPIIDGSFANLTINTAAYLLENNSIYLQKNLVAHIFDVFGEVFRSCDHSASISAKIMQVLQHLDNERAVAQVASGFREMVEDKKGSWNVLFSSLMKEFGRIDTDDVTKEGGTAKSYGIFLVTLAQCCPFYLISHISQLMVHMDGESYSMRNSVLTVLVELVLALLGGEHRSNEEKRQRDKLLEKVEEHVRDINAFTRAKCIQLWTRLFEEEGVPLSRLHSVLPVIADRLQDRASTVRKAAMHFMTTVLRKNPYRDKLNLEELESLLKEAQEKLETLKKDDTEKAIEKVAEMWNELKEAVLEEISSFLKCSMRQQSGTESMDFGGENGAAASSASRVVGVRIEELDRNLDPDDWLQLIYSFLDNRKFAAAADFVLRLFKIVGSKNELFSKWTEEELSEEPERINLVFIALGDIFIRLTMSKLEMEMGEGEEDGFAFDRHAEELEKQRRTVRYLQDTVHFAKTLQSVLPRSTDVIEAVEFVVACAEFKVPGSRLAIRQLCNLIWRKDSTIREATVKAFKRLFLDVDGAGNKRNCNLLVAKNLIDMTVEATMSELASLEEVVAEMMKQELLKQEVLNVFWEYFMMTVSGGCTQAQSQAAVQLIAMAAKANKALISANLDTLVKYGLGERAERDFGFGKEVCYALQMLGVKVDLKSEKTLKEEPFRLEPDHELFLRLTTILLQGVGNFDDTKWSVLMEHAVNVIFFLAENADKIVARLIKHVVRKMNTDLTELDKDESKEALQRARSCYLVRLLSLVGHAALRVLIHLDVAYCGELKRRAYLKELQKSPSRRRKSRLSLQRNNSDSRPGTPQNNDTCEEEMGLAGAIAEDIEQEIAAKICDEEVLSDRSVIGQIKPVVLEICDPKNWSRFSAEVQTAAALALSKMMLVSNIFCTESLQVFFTMMRKNPIASVRANLMVAAGDLSFRFPNDIEQWSEELYDRLYDSDQCVRQNCLLVLTHLILNDMIKPKGKVASIAAVTIDGRKEMSGLAKRFFTEMAQKGDAVYNLMPDIISRLSSDQSMLRSKQEFHQIMKDLRSKEVYDHFISILNSAKKGAKPETKVVIEELEEKISELHSEKFEDEEAAERAKAALRRKSLESKKKLKSPAAATGRSPSRRTTRRGKPKINLNISDENMSDD